MSPVHRRQAAQSAEREDGTRRCLWVGHRSMQSSGYAAAVRQWPTLSFTQRTCKPPPPSVRKMILQMHTPARTGQCWSQKTQDGLGVCIWMHLVNGTGNSLSLGRPTPGVFKQDKSSRGSVDTTKTCSDPQRVRICKGQRPIGTAKRQRNQNHGVAPSYFPVW